MKLFNRFTKSINIDALAGLCTFLFIAAGILVSLNRYWQYTVFYYDFGIFDSAIWSVSRFQPPIIDHLAIGGKWIFADHFSPSIFLLSPLYWFTDRQEIILIAQSVIVGLSGFVLYQIGKEVIKNKFLSLSVVVSYFLFVGLQNAIITDFHEVTVSTLPLMLAFWALIKKKTVWYFIFLIITFGFKESTFVLGIAIGICIFLLWRDRYKIALATILVAIAWGFFTIQFIIPHFSDGVYNYSLTSGSGSNISIGALFDNPLKRRTLYYSFLSFGFLPLFAWQFWILLLQDFVTRFIPVTPTRWDLGLHYSAQLASLMAISTIYGIKRISTIPIVSKYLPFLGILLMLNAFYLYRFVLHGPFGLAYNPAFYKQTSNFVFLDTPVKKIPPNASVAAQNNLAVRFTHQKVWLLRNQYYVYQPDYIIFDKRAGQDLNDLFGTGNIVALLERLRYDTDYVPIYATQDQFVYKRVTQKK